MEELFKDILLKESAAFNEFYCSLQKQLEVQQTQIKIVQESLDSKYRDYKHHRDMLAEHLAKRYGKYGDTDEDIIQIYKNGNSPDFYMFKDEYIVTKIKNILEYHKLSNTLSTLKYDEKYLKEKISGLSHLNTDCFYYSALEAFKSVIPENDIYSEYVLDDRFVPTIPRLKITYTFPHNIETNVRYIDERLVNIFESAFNNELIKPVRDYGSRTYIPLITKY